MSRPTREARDDHGRHDYALLAQETGLSVDEIAAIAARGELKREYQKFIDHNGLYRMGSAPGNSIEQRRSPRALLSDIEAKRWPAGSKSARVALLETLRRRWDWEDE